MMITDVYSQKGGPEWGVFNTSNSDLPGDLIFTLMFDHAGRLWVETNQNGAGLYDGVTLINYNTSNSGLLANRVMCFT